MAFVVTGLVFIACFVILGVAALRAGMLPRAGAGLVTIGAPLFGAGGLIGVPLRTLGIVLFGVGLILLGWALWSGGER